MELEELAIQASLSLSPIQVELGDKFISMVLKWNKTRNLVSRNSSKKYEINANLGTVATKGITSSGDIVPGADDTYDLGAVGNVWRNIYTGDLHLNNEHKNEGNIADGSKGSWTLQEGANDIYLINNKSNEKFRIKLEKI